MPIATFVPTEVENTEERLARVDMIRGIVLWVAFRCHPRETLMMPMSTRGDYGFDAPYALIAFAALGTGSSIAAIVSRWNGSRGRLTVMLGFYALFFLGNAFSFFYKTRRGKFQVWNDILDALRLRGDERVLDMGCGRGAVLTAVARRLTTGRVTGVDLWSTSDQSGNARAVTLQNASVEGVRDRIDVQTGDMRELPFPDGSFDVV